MVTKTKSKHVSLNEIWYHLRANLEADNYKHKRFGGKRKSHWTLFERLVHVFGYFLKAINLYERGLRNAKNIVVNEVELNFANLPSEFDGYTILHLTDLHLDCVIGIENLICEKLKGLSYDLCVITGDFREHNHGGFKQILQPLEKIMDAIKAKDGTYTVLGNHDSYLMVSYLEKIGMKVLNNETVSIHRNGEQITLTGVDDPNCYYTDQAWCELERANGNFKITLAHSPELYDISANNDYQLYLCGHTHGGQICLPGGIPIFNHINDGRRFSKGLWKYKNMTGYTSQGCGASGIPIRFNSESEVVLITMKKAK